jgi:phage terminase small subunit
VALTPKQERFVAEYLVDLNATQAAIRAGYSEKTAKVIGQENLTKPDVAEAIAKRQKRIAEKLEVTQENIVKELAHIAFDDISNYLDFWTDEETGEVKVRVKDSKTIDTRSISEVQLGKDGQFKFKTYCKDNALVQLGKHLGMFTEKVEHSGQIEHKIELIDSYEIKG